MSKDPRELKPGDTTLESLGENVVAGEEEPPAIEISEQREFFKVPKKFGNVPVEEVPLGYTKGKGYNDKYPYVDLPFQKIEEINFGSSEIEPKNKLYWGDNIHIMRALPSESVDLIYIDPPFFSGKIYNVVFGDENEVRSFNDIWDGGMPTYLIWLNSRLLEMKRLLKQTGSIYVHLDWHASHYVKVEMDKIFGYDNFINEIVWIRTRNPKGSQFKAKKFGQGTDSILLYSKTSDYKLEISKIRRGLEESELNNKYNLQDEKGRYYSGPIVSTAGMGPRPNLVYEYKGYTPPPSGWRLSKEKLLDLDRNGDLGWSKTGKPFRKLRPENDQGEPLYNVWTDINRLYGGSPEALGYPTQKPEALLERIIGGSSEQGDVVADFFCGGGTTAVVAQKLGRRWIASDISRIAVEITKGRVLRMLKGEGNGWFIPQNTPNMQVLSWGYYDIPSLSTLSDDNFKSFILKAFGARRISDPVADGIKDGIPVWVGPRDHKMEIKADDVLSFAEYLEKNYETKKRGIMVAWQFSDKAKQAKDMLAQLGAGIDFVSINLVTIGSEDFRGHVTTKKSDYETLLRFILPPVVRLKVRALREREYEFDFSESVSLNNGKVINVQADFEYDNVFIPTTGYALTQKRDSMGKIVLNYEFDKSGDKKIAFKIEDDQGGEAFVVRELEVE